MACILVEPPGRLTDFPSTVAADQLRLVIIILGTSDESGQPLSDIPKLAAKFSPLDPATRASLAAVQPPSARP